MVPAGSRSGNPVTRVLEALGDVPAWLDDLEGAALGEGLIELRDVVDRTESFFAGGLRRFDKSGDYAADGAIGIVPWLRWRCRLSASAAAERVGIARQIEQLPKTEEAFARGELGYQHVAVMARTAEHVGAAAVRKAEASLLKAAETMDPGQFVGVAKNFEHRVDAAGALAETNRAYERRYFHIGEAVDGLVRLDGLLDAEAGATVRTALNPFMKPGKADDRTAGQRLADALLELCKQRPSGKNADGAGPRPQLIIRATVETLAGIPGAPAGELEGGSTVPAETVQRLACDSAISRIVAKGELDFEITRASRSIPPATRRALAARDHQCVAQSCDRQPSWCDGHHRQFWTNGGPTTLPNLVLLCRPHHRMVHEGGFELRRAADGRWALIRPVAAHARSA